MPVDAFDRTIILGFGAIAALMCALVLECCVRGIIRALYGRFDSFTDKGDDVAHCVLGVVIIVIFVLTCIWIVYGIGSVVEWML